MIQVWGMNTHTHTHKVYLDWTFGWSSEQLHGWFIFRARTRSYCFISIWLSLSSIVVVSRTLWVVIASYWVNQLDSETVYFTHTQKQLAKMGTILSREHCAHDDNKVDPFSRFRWIFATPADSGSWQCYLLGSRIQPSGSGSVLESSSKHNEHNEWCLSPKPITCLAPVWLVLHASMLFETEFMTGWMDEPRTD